MCGCETVDVRRVRCGCGCEAVGEVCRCGCEAVDVRHVWFGEVCG